jgi:steroid 5-alpha reductase family enzyme
MGDVMMAAAVAIAILMVTVWIISVILNDASIVDLIWGLGFVIVAWVVLATTEGTGPRGWLLVGLTTVWGLRLSVHLAVRNLGHGEDFRYQKMRAKSPDDFWWKSLFSVFLLQGVLMWIVSLPVQIGQRPPGRPLGLLDLAGVMVWVIGFYFETVGDHQLGRFKADPANRGRVLDTGLWRYTRHPNYFGDFMVWWGLYLIAAAAGAWWTALGPIVMSILLMRVSGVGLLESTIGDRRPGYDDYIRRTNAFFPGPRTPA